MWKRFTCFKTEQPVLSMAGQRAFIIPNPAASCKGFSCIQNISLGPFMIFGNQNLPKYLWAFSLLHKFSPNSLDKLFSADGLLWIACEFFTLTSVLCLLGGLISSWAEWLKCLQGRKNEHRMLNKKQCISRTNIFSWLFSQTLSEISSNRWLPCGFWMLWYIYACKPNSSHTAQRVIVNLFSILSSHVTWSEPTSRVFAPGSCILTTAQSRLSPLWCGGSLTLLGRAACPNYTYLLALSSSK